MDNTSHTETDKGMNDMPQAPYTTRAGAMSDPADTLEPKGATVDTGICNPVGDAVEGMRTVMREAEEEVQICPCSDAGAMVVAPAYWKALHTFDGNEIKDMDEEEAWCKAHYYPFDEAMHAASINSTSDALAILDFVDVWARKLKLLDEYDGMPNRLMNATAYLFAALGMERPSGGPVVELPVDPIYAAIEKHKRTFDHPESPEQIILANKALDSFTDTIPTTIAGLSAKIDYMNETEMDDIDAAAIARDAKVLAGIKDDDLDPDEHERRHNEIMGSMPMTGPEMLAKFSYITNDPGFADETFNGAFVLSLIQDAIRVVGDGLRNTTTEQL